MSRQLPIPLPQPGQFDRAATTLPQTMDVRPQLYCRLRSQGCSRKEHCQKWEVSRVTGPVVDKEKEKEKGGWFSKFKKGSQKSAVLQKQPYPAAQMQHFQYSSSLCNRNATPRKKCCPSTTRICHLMHNLLDRFLTARKTPRSHSQVPFGASTRTRWTCLLQLKCEFLTSTASVASSYAASISTVDIAEAYAQPIMKPQLITVQRVTTAPLQLSSQQQPRANAGPSLVWSEESQGGKCWAESGVVRGVSRVLPGTASAARGLTAGCGGTVGFLAIYRVEPSERWGNRIFYTTATTTEGQ
ncbi:hypothetical protein HYQ46_007911 [Verticillium longisporum]|nr:hypothetical protein HYQ46_007911 [Verticillium longisporum]